MASGSPRIVDAKAFVPYVQASYEGGMLTLQFDCLVSQEGSMKAAELLKVLHDDFGLSLDLEKADIARLDLYAAGPNGEKRPLLQADGMTLESGAL